MNVYRILYDMFDVYFVLKLGLNYNLYNFLSYIWYKLLIILI